MVDDLSECLIQIDLTSKHGPIRFIQELRAYIKGTSYPQESVVYLRGMMEEMESLCISSGTIMLEEEEEDNIRKRMT